MSKREPALWKHLEEVHHGPFGRWWGVLSGLDENVPIHITEETVRIVRAAWGGRWPGYGAFVCLPYRDSRWVEFIEIKGRTNNLVEVWGVQYRHATVPTACGPWRRERRNDGSTYSINGGLLDAFRDEGSTNLTWMDGEPFGPFIPPINDSTDASMGHYEEHEETMATIWECEPKIDRRLRDGIAETRRYYKRVPGLAGEAVAFDVLTKALAAMIDAHARAGASRNKRGSYARVTTVDLKKVVEAVRHGATDEQLAQLCDLIVRRYQQQH